MTIDAWRAEPPPVHGVIANFVLHYNVPAEDLARLAQSLAPGGCFAANFFRGSPDQVDGLASLLGKHGLHLRSQAQIEGTKAANVLLAFGKRL
jgi:hypothetical protein